MHPFDVIAAAVEPEDLFGPDPARCKAFYRRLVRQVHPDNNGNSEAATRAFRSLQRLWETAQELIAAGQYGEARSTVTIKTRTATYTVRNRIGRGAISDVFIAHNDGGSYAVKVPRSPRDDDLMKAESRTLRRLELDDPYRPFLPELLDTAGLKQSGGIRRQVNVFKHLKGWVSLQDVIDAYPAGIHPQDMAWMWRRLLFILGATHEAGVVHGAVLPPNVMIHPRLHGLVLNDWCYAVERGERVTAIERDYRDWYAPEVIQRKPAGPESDIFTAAASMLALCGATSMTPPDSMPAPLRAFFRGCALPMSRRPADAWQLQQDFDEVLERTYGRRRYRVFAMPS